jgi:hypothetical protein
LVVVVHGDASYTFHDTTGTRQAADEKVLREAFAAARSMPSAEAFVFHQRSRRAIFGLFPRDDGTVYHFVAGRLASQQAYRRTSGWDTEITLVRERARVLSPERRIVAYYGHAVPETLAPYHRSRPDDSLSVDRVAKAVQMLGGADVSVLSTCYGGTPNTVTALSPATRYLVASPGDLHLSMIDADLLSMLTREGPVETTVDAFTRRAFQRLTDRTVTETVLARYDTEAAASTARALGGELPSATGAQPAVDCTTQTDAPIDTAGVRVWYRSAAFGRPGAATHSGWACAPSR